jgi:hypothetical protein
LTFFSNTTQQAILYDTYSIVNNSGGTTSMSFAPAIGSSIEVAFSWPEDGSTIADAFRIDTQISGTSSSGAPDIDLWVVPANSSTVITRAALAAVVDAATFKVDLTPSSASVVQRRANIPLQ